MLKRISKIKNVGSFQNCHGGSVAFDKVTLIYGRNTYGKSTLGDIFSSLQRNDPGLIIARRSIPGIDGGQEIELNFAADGEKERDGIVRFCGGEWKKGLRSSHQLSVYDDAFYHDYLFSARQFTRDTKLKFSSFILGKQGVKQASVIAAKNGEKRSLSSRLHELKRDAFSGISDLDQFLEIEPVVDLSATTADRDEFMNRYAVLKNQKVQAHRICTRAELQSSQLDFEINRIAISFNNILTESIESCHQQAKVRLESHIKSHFRNESMAERWLQQGLPATNQDSCNFCGQSLSPDALELIEAYRECFNDEYQRHEEFVQQQLTQILGQLQSFDTSQIPATLESNRLVFQQYPELHEIPGFPELKARYESAANCLNISVAASNTALQKLLSECQAQEILKRAKPHELQKTVDFSIFEAALSELLRALGVWNTEIVSVNQSFSKYRSDFDEDRLVNNMAELEAQGTALSTAIKRTECRVQCDEFLKTEAGSQP